VVTQPPIDPPSTIWRILYHSRDRLGRDVAVSGFAIVPDAPLPAGARRLVYAWAHGLIGQADRCAPSRHIRDNLPPYGGQQLEAGAVLTATDYDGLGTPGEPTALVGVALGHAVLDSIPAASQLPAVGHWERSSSPANPRAAAPPCGPPSWPTTTPLNWAWQGLWPWRQRPSRPPS
jgi:hypothetical protein